jgi:hypothetical protein
MMVPEGIFQLELNPESFYLSQYLSRVFWGQGTGVIWTVLHEHITDLECPTELNDTSILTSCLYDSNRTSGCSPFRIRSCQEFAYSGRP